MYVDPIRITNNQAIAKQGETLGSGGSGQPAMPFGLLLNDNYYGPKMVRKRG
jgi:hypothetical protein